MNLSNKTLTKLLLVLTCGLLLSFVTVNNSQASIKVEQHHSNGNLIAQELGQSDIGASSVFDFTSAPVFSNTPVKEDNSRLTTAINYYNEQVKIKFGHCLHHIQNTLLNHRKADLLYPSYYFW